MRIRATITCIRMGLTLTMCSLVFAVSAFAQDPKPTGYWAFGDITMQDVPLKHPVRVGTITGKRGSLHTTDKSFTSFAFEEPKLIWAVDTDWTWTDPPGVLVPGELVTVRLGYQGGSDPAKQYNRGEIKVNIDNIEMAHNEVYQNIRFHPKSFLEADGTTFKKGFDGVWSEKLTNYGIEKTEYNYLPEKSVDFVGKVGKHKGDPRPAHSGNWISLRVSVSGVYAGARTYYYNYKWVEGAPPKDGIKIPPPVDDKSSSGNTTGHGSTSQPPAGTVEPANTTKFTIQAGKRTAKSGETVQVPVFLLNPSGVGNLNTTVSYTSSVAMAEGKPIRGNVLGSALFEANAAEAGIARVGVAGSKPLTESGILAHITFKAVGKPGDRTILKVAVTTANANDGKSMLAETIDGEVIIVGEGGKIPGDQDGDGEITASDALSALKMSVKLIPENMTLDMDTDAKVTSNDARLILLKAVGK